MTVFTYCEEWEWVGEETNKKQNIESNSPTTLMPSNLFVSTSVDTVKGSRITIQDAC